MKRAITVLFFLVIITPSIAFASWWKPWTWNIWSIFQRKAVPVETVVTNPTPSSENQEDKITELQKQIDDLKNNKIPEVNNQNKVTKNTSIATDLNKQTTATQPIVPQNTATTTKTCASGKVVSLNDYCTKTCSDGEVILETLTCIVHPVTPPTIDVCNNIEGIQTTVPQGLISQNNNCIVEISTPEISVSQGGTSVNTTGNSINAHKYINDFVIYNGSNTPLLLKNITYKISSNYMDLRDRDGFSQKMSVGVYNTATVPDYLGSNSTIVKTFDVPVTLPGGGTTIRFIYNPTYMEIGAVNPYLQVTIQSINTSPSTNNNLPVTNRATLITSN